MDLTAILVLTGFQYIAVFCLWFVWYQIRLWFNFKWYTWALLLVPLFGIVYGVGRLFIASLKR